MRFGDDRKESFSRLSAQWGEQSLGIDVGSALHQPRKVRTNGSSLKGQNIASPARMREVLQSIQKV